MSESSTSIIGNLTADPELRYTPAGVPVANFTIASTPRVFDRETKEFKDGEPLFIRCSIWRETAENLGASLSKGTRVLAIGRLKPNTYETKEGETRSTIEMEVDEIGPSLRFNEVSVKPRSGAARKAAPANSNEPAQEQEAPKARASKPASRPAAKAKPAAASAGGGW